MDEERQQIMEMLDAGTITAEVDPDFIRQIREVGR